MARVGPSPRRWRPPRARRPIRHRRERRAHRRARLLGGRDEGVHEAPWPRNDGRPAGVALNAKRQAALALAATGLPDTEIARRTGARRETICKWRRPRRSRPAARPRERRRVRLRPCALSLWRSHAPSWGARGSSQPPDPQAVALVARNLPERQQAGPDASARGPRTAPRGHRKMPDGSRRRRRGVRHAVGGGRRRVRRARGGAAWGREARAAPWTPGAGPACCSARRAAPTPSPRASPTPPGPPARDRSPSERRSPR